MVATGHETYNPKCFWCHATGDALDIVDDLACDTPTQEVAYTRLRHVIESLVERCGNPEVKP